MSAKRKPETELNHDNWNDEEEPEESGIFQKADETELRQRKIKVAKRRLGGDDGTPDSPKPNVFSGFSGFGTPMALASAPTPAAKPMFNFGSFNAQTSNTLSTLPSSAKTFSFTSVDGKEPAKQLTLPTGNITEHDKSSDYATKLTKLNKSIFECIKQHIESGKLCILTPIFDDYKKHLKEIEDEKEKTKQKPVTFSFVDKTTNNGKQADKSTDLIVTTTSVAIVSTTLAPTFTFSSAIASTAATSSLTSPKPTFSFGSGQTTFGSSSTSTTPGAGFFSFSKPPEQKPSTSDEKKDENGGDNDDEDQPPKVEFTPVTEDDSLYSKRCKIFVKSADEFKPRGTGMLYIKEVSGKKQLLVRADTSLGNILLNILFASIPFKRLGTNNLCTACIPTPESEQKPVQVLIRVKNEEEADELLAEIEKHQT